MLEVKNLKKVYKTKNGTDVNALDGVSLRFPETGMVFLLGKSGSGKSTLLNVCGGLDSPSEGEIIVKGRSSKNFTQSDFDSYRNTFIGFIFQEYNILYEFSVEDNIALALELQGKPKDKAAINALLKEVDLQSFAKRKPNTLSGGQKQRVAIARALVKSPEIIMADEPTGALDSNTGKQVFETLKKLSRDKLVIVVSHDRDFAELYGDRIIELKDGKVISDLSKTKEQQHELTANISTVGDVLCVKRGSDLTDTDFEKIKSFLKNSDNNIIIANNEKDVKNFKKITRISDDGSKEVLCNTTEPSIKQYTERESRFIRSKLPLKHAVKIGVSSLRSKPIRLCFTVLLCTIAFTLFGLLSTLNFYDSHATFVQTMQDTNTSVMSIEKDYRTKVTGYSKGKKEYEYESYGTAKFTDSEYKKLSSALGSDAFGAFGVYNSFNLRQANSDYWINTISAFAVLPENHSLRGKINGEYPKAKDEIVISSYAADMIYNCKAYNSDGTGLELSDPQAIIGKKIVIGGFTYKVTGILDSGEIPAEYEALKENTEPNSSLAKKYNSFLEDGLHFLAFVTTERLEQIASENKPFIESIENYTYVAAALKTNGEYKLPEWSNANYINISSLNSNKTIISISSNNNKPADNEVILSSSVFSEVVVQACNVITDSAGDNYEYAQKYYDISEIAYQVRDGGVYKHNSETDKDELVLFTDAELESKLSQLINAVKNNNLSLKLGVKLFDQYNNNSFGDTTELSIIGVYVEKDMTYANIALSEATFNRLWNEQKAITDYYSVTESNYKEKADALFTKIYLQFDYSEETVNSYWELYDNDDWNEDGSRIRLSGNFVDNLKMVDETVKQMSTIFLYVALVLAVFAILLFSNFISASISQKKKEIGILRAVGARSTDVFKIFFSESVIISILCVFLSTVASIVFCNIINNSLASGIGASLFVFGFSSLAVLITVALVTVVAATFLPVFNAAKKKPVDSIRAL